MRLNQVTVHVTDLERSVGFYKTLGLKQIVASERYARFVCPDGDETFSVEVADDVPLVATDVIYFECDDVDSEVRALKGRGVVFDTEPIDQSWLWREAYLRDPDGHVLCLYHAGENRRNPPWRLRD
ncbi:MAG: VOC family protein [Actinobacteria bacterium]|nr:MAG: VOC family protein [Actinomycetota bacterium]